MVLLKSLIFALIKTGYKKVIMIIANPIYDVVFKRLMENERVARFFIGTLLEQNIVSLEVKPQELTHITESERTNNLPVALFRLDFVATIQTEDGEYKKVLIELQKAYNYLDIIRFRGYLAEQYKKKEIVNNRDTLLPITTIYILGFRLPDIETACVRVERNYMDLINQTILTTRSRFIESLTHDSYVVQVDRITDRYQTKLDKLLSVFEQNYFTDDTKVVKRYKHTPDNEEVKLITDILHYCGTEPEERREIEMEQEAWRSIDALSGGVFQKLDDALKTLEEKDKVIEEKDKTLEENAKVMKEKDKTLEALRKEIERLKRVES
jgi:hypothetical protein